VDPVGMTTIRIGVIGTGIMGADHVETISKSVSRAEVRAVADLDVRRAEAVAARVPGAKALPSAEALIESTEVDAVIIASSNPTHAPYALASIGAGKPVLCEKPLAQTAAECEQILRGEEAAGKRLVQVGFMRRYDPGYAELRARVASGEIGAPLLAHCVHRNVSIPPVWTSEDIVFTSAVHEIDVMPWVFGREVVSVNWLSPIPAAPGVRRDPQVAILELEGGALIFVELFMAARYGYEIRCEIVGEKGTIELAPVARTVARSDLRVNLDLSADWRPRFAEAYRRELQTWVNAICAWRSGGLKGIASPVHGPDAWDGYRAAVIAEALVASMSSGGPARVKSLSIPEFYQQRRTKLTESR